MTDRAKRPLAAKRLTAAVRIAGIGLHTGEPCACTLAPAQTGWWMGAAGYPPQPLALTRIASTHFGTSVELESGHLVRTVEHVFACLQAWGIESVTITVEGPEMPAMDGSAAPLCAALAPHIVPAPTSYWTPPERLRVELDDAFITVEPGPDLAVSCAIAFDELPPEVATSARWSRRESFCKALAPARTFAFGSWLDSLVTQGLARGGSLENAVIFDGSRVLNPEGLRFDNEPARHKLLDLVGDLALLGQPLRAQVEAYKPGHQLNAKLVRALRALAYA